MLNIVIITLLVLVGIYILVLMCAVAKEVAKCKEAAKLIESLTEAGVKYKEGIKFYNRKYTEVLGYEGTGFWNTKIKYRFKTRKECGVSDELPFKTVCEALSISPESIIRIINGGYILDAAFIIIALAYKPDLLTDIIKATDIEYNIPKKRIENYVEIARKAKIDKDPNKTIEEANNLEWG